MKKESRVNKKVLLLSLVLFSLIIINFVSVTAADAAPTPDNIFRRWVNSTLTNIDAKIILFLMVAVILYVLFYTLSGKSWIGLVLSLPMTFVLTIYVTPPSVIGILKSYNTLPLMITSIVPLIVLSAFTYLAIIKNKKPLILGQHSAWIFFGCYLVLRLVALAYTYFFALGATDELSRAIDAFALLPTEDESITFWIAFTIQIVAAVFMTFQNGWIIGIIGGSVEKTEEAVAKRNVDKTVAGLQNIKAVQVRGFEKM